MKVCTKIDGASIKSNIVPFKEACEILGYSKTKLYNWALIGIIPCYKREKIFFRRNVLEHWIIKNEGKTSYQIRTEALNIIPKGKRKKIKMKVCSTCGEEKPEQAFDIIPNKPPIPGVVYINKKVLNKHCRHCLYLKRKEKIKKYTNKYKEKNKQKLAEAHRKWREKNKQKYKEIMYNYTERNLDSVRTRRRINSKRMIDELKPIYVRRLLKNKGFTIEQIKENKELIELQKIIIKTKRLCQSQTLKNLEKA